MSEDRVAPPDGGLRKLLNDIVLPGHQALRVAVARLQALLDELAARDIPDRAGVAGLRERFARLADDLDRHLLKEESILFPALWALEGGAAEVRASAFPPGTLVHPIKAMEADHQRLEQYLLDLRHLAHDYCRPDSAEPAAACYDDLARFERQLRDHLEFEDEHLFPAALAAERRFLG